MFVEALFVDVQIPLSSSLKDKRTVVRHLLEGARRRFAVSAAEVDHQDLLQRAGLGFAVVGAASTQIEELLDALERFVWSHPEIVVLETERSYLDAER